MWTSKHCACGRTYDVASWGRLPLVGSMDNGRDRGELLELRQCPCGSSLAVPIGEHDPSDSSIRLLPTR